MKYFIFIFLLVSHKCYCQLQVVQAPVENRNSPVMNNQKEYKAFNKKSDSVRREANKITWNIFNQDKWDYAFHSTGENEWYISKNSISKRDEIIKIKIMTYLPELKLGNIFYKDVVLEETMLCDCPNKQYKIINGTYYKNYYQVLDIFDNPKGEMENIVEKTIFYKLHEKICLKFNK